MDVPLLDAVVVENSKTPSKSNKTTPMKSVHSRSRSGSTGSRCHTINSRPRSRKRKHQSHRSPSPHKRAKEEPSMTNGVQSKSPTNKDGPTTSVDSECGCLLTPIKLEAKDEDETRSTVFICPRVNIVDCENAAPSQTDEGAKSDSSSSLSDKDDLDMKSEANTTYESTEKVESVPKIVE